MIHELERKFIIKKPIFRQDSHNSKIEERLALEEQLENTQAESTLFVITLEAPLQFKRILTVHMSDIAKFTLVD